ncbi:hypothetical protein [uncultured Chryseobacterium sp.]|uniref:hypothetical protein n=1 Tax=uncultured Chryseobacterium sp. TaxID=259322 RepID=UPI0025E1E208|nr:hypothetical protein [uncultured Chryseobacterium sp.]
MQDKFSKQIILLSFLLFANYFFSQNRKLNLIIVNDREISKSIYDFKITPFNSSLDEAITGKYIPGELILDSKDFDRLLSSNTKDFKISFTIISTVNKDLVKDFKYAITIPKVYLNSEYLIVNIFNIYNKISKRKYSKLIKSDKDYYIIIETPNSMKFD